MRKKIALLLIGMVAVLLGRWLFYYGGFYTAPGESVTGNGEVILLEPLLTDFIDTPSGEVSGTVLIDNGHGNNYTSHELNVLVSRLISRELTIRFLNASDDLEELLLGKEGGRKDSTPVKSPGDEKKDPEPIAFIVICPGNAFSRDDRETVSEFLDRGGRLLLIGDPTRESEINSLALDFGLIFEDDYLYNHRENETNYCNIFIRDFKENGVTAGLTRIVLYTAGSITSKDSATCFTDENTFSSRIETRRNLSPIALTGKPGVLAVHDLTFMTEPYNGIADNNKLISNIADWLAGGTLQKEPPSETPSPSPSSTPSPSPSPSP